MLSLAGMNAALAPGSLQNLLKIGQLKEHAADSTEVQRRLAAVNRNLIDAEVTTISPETRFATAWLEANRLHLSVPRQ